MRAPVIIITADHGEGFMDHGTPDHGRDLYAESINVPLVISLPQPAAKAVIKKPVSLIDITPTVLSLLAPPVMLKQVYPHITYTTEYSFTLGGTRFELYHASGESQDYTIVFMPDQKIVWAGDMLGDSMPMVASPMKRVRDEVKWVKGLKRIKGLKPEIMIQAVEPPFDDTAVIERKIDTAINFLNFLHQSVAREMNAGSSLEETLNNIKLPLRMRLNPFLRERYASLQFNVRGLYHRYSGWFDRNGTHLNPIPEEEKARSFIGDMGGAKAVMRRVDKLYKKNQYQLALEYLDLLITADRQSEEAHRLKGDILLKLAGESRHYLTGNMYRRLGKRESDSTAGTVGNQ